MSFLSSVNFQKLIYRYSILFKQIKLINTMINNPENQIKLSQSKLSSISKFIAFQTLSKEKQQRKYIQSQRQIIQHHVANLYRQVKKASKQLTSTQLALIQDLNKKNNKQQHLRWKEQQKKLKQQQLHQLKNTNSLARYMSMLKRQQAKRRMLKRNCQLSTCVKSRGKIDQQLKKMTKIQQNKNLSQKNILFDKNIKLGVQISRKKNLYKKKCLSSVVRNDLIELENIKKQKQRQAIQQLTKRQKQLKQIFSKAKNQKVKYQSLLELGKGKSFIEMYEVVAYKQGQKLFSSRKSKKMHKNKRGLSQQNIVGSYVDLFGDF